MQINSKFIHLLNGVIQKDMNLTQIHLYLT